MRAYNKTIIAKRDNVNGFNLFDAKTGFFFENVADTALDAWLATYRAKLLPTLNSVPDVTKTPDSIECSNMIYPTVTTLREIAEAVGARMSHSAKYSSNAKRASRLIRFHDVENPAWLTIRQACQLLAEKAGSNVLNVNI